MLHVKMNNAHSKFPLAVVSPNLGARSETFIRRHMQDILPGQTVVVAHSDAPPYCGHWDVDAPSLCLNRLRIADMLPELALQIMTTGSLRIDKHCLHIRKVEQFLRQHHVKVILGEYLDITHPYIALAKKLGIRLLAHAHGYDISIRLRDESWRQKYLDYNQTAGIITVNQSAKNRLVELGIAQEKITVIPCGVDVPAKPPHKTQDNSAHVNCLAVGRMVGKKAPILLLDAFRRALQQQPNLLLNYVGVGELMPAVRQFIHAFNLQNHVRLLGSQPNETVQTLMQQADIFLQHSIVEFDSGDEEGLPVAILEAMSNGLPVVSTQHAGIGEAVVDGVTGYLVGESDTLAMADRIIDLASSQEKRRTFGVSGWERIKKHFTWERERIQLIELVCKGL
jgi:glycosyltransferase involved in cell wall biosynthesis